MARITRMCPENTHGGPRTSAFALGTPPLGPRGRRGEGRLRSQSIQRFLAFALSRWTGRYERLLGERKRTLLQGLTGQVLELGPGTGANLKYYGADVRWTGLEPNPYMHAYLHAEANRRVLAMDLRLGTAERTELPAASIDAVVGTLVLCSVPDVGVVLGEILRVLKPGGQFVFIEHVAAPRGTALRYFQRLGNPITQFLGDGCHLDRETWWSIEHAGFGHVECEHFRIRSPFNGPHIAGRAVR